MNLFKTFTLCKQTKEVSAPKQAKFQAEEDKTDPKWLLIASKYVGLPVRQYIWIIVFDMDFSVSTNCMAPIIWLDLMTLSLKIQSKWFYGSI